MRFTEALPGRFALIARLHPSVLLDLLKPVARDPQRQAGLGVGDDPKEFLDILKISLYLLPFDL